MMDKKDVIVFASICALSFFYILLFNNKDENRKKIEIEIDQAINEIIKKNNDSNNDFNRFSTEK